MAEAAVKPTLRQERLAEAILDPNIKTKQAALLKAGYSPATARAAAGRQLELAGTQNALQARRARQRDKAREIEEVAGERAIEALKRETDPAVLVQSWATGRKGRFEYPDEDGPGDRDEAQRKYKRAIHLAFLFGYIAAKRAFAPQDVVVSQLDVQDYQAKARNDAP